MEFRVLGPVEVQVGAEIVRLPGTNARTLLARLLVDAGRVVSVDVLADALWDSTPPANVANSIQANVSKLRTALERHLPSPEVQTTIATQGRGYVLRLDGHALDAHRATEMLAAARDARRDGAAQQAASTASKVLALYRGEPYADVAYRDWIQPEVHRLNELRMEATEVLYAARLDLGHHGELIAALESLVATHPLRERLRGLLMLALYRAGRQADALRCYSAGREMLADELGIDPGPELRELERRILDQDPDLDARRESTTPSVARGVVGRERERQLLTAALRASASHGTQVVLVHGEPGIGKTALASWLIAEAEASAALVVHGRAPSVGGAPPYWPWTEALRSLIEARPAVLATLTPSDVGVLARLVPWLGDSDVPTSALPSAFMFDAVSRLLATVSADAPLVVVLDDLHWADDGTLDLFHYVATSRSRSQLLLVGIARADVEPNHPLRAHVASLASQPQVSHLGLSGLALDEIAELVSEVTGSQHELHLAEVLHDRTGGNPFFIREVLRVATDDSGRFDLSRVVVPDSVRDVIRGRVARLGPDAPAVFTVLSFARDAFTTVLADHLVEIGPEGVMDVVDAGLAAGLLIDVPGRPGFYRFAHSLVRHVFYDGLPAARRAEMHLRVGRVLEEVALRPMEIANELAWHYSHASTVGGAADAVRWERVAAEKACRSLAYQEAVHHLRRALASVRKVLRDEALEHEVLSELATAAHAAGDTHTASVAEQRMESLR